MTSAISVQDLPGAPFGGLIEATDAASFTAAAEANAHLASDWPDIQLQLNEIMRPVDQIRASLEAVKAPTSPQDIGIPAAFYKDAIMKSRLIRDRFTCLDFAASAGILGQVADEVVQA